MTHTRSLRTVVLVAGEPTLRKEARDLFETAGLQVIAFDDGEGALAYLDLHKDDVEGVFADLGSCGGPDGAPLVNRIGQVCPSIAVMATAEAGTDRPVGLDPQVRFLVRPWSSIDVVSAMQDAVMDQ
jgi:CheY-like chemotaxis protein